MYALYAHSTQLHITHYYLHTSIHTTHGYNTRQSSPRGTPKIRVEYGWGRSSQQKTCNFSETDRTKVTIADQKEIAYALATGAKMNDLV